MRCHGAAIEQIEFLPSVLLDKAADMMNLANFLYTALLVDYSCYTDNVPIESGFVQSKSLWHFVQLSHLE